MDLNELAFEVRELAGRTRLCAINLAVTAAKVKLAEPAFRATNERVVSLVTRATEVAGRVERLTRQLEGDASSAHDHDQASDSVIQLEDCMREVERLSTLIVEEVRRLSAHVPSTPKGAA